MISVRGALQTALSRITGDQNTWAAGEATAVWSSLEVHQSHRSDVDPVKLNLEANVAPAQQDGVGESGDAGRVTRYGATCVRPSYAAGVACHDTVYLTAWAQWATARLRSCGTRS